MHILYRVSLSIPDIHRIKSTLRSYTSQMAKSWGTIITVLVATSLGVYYFNPVPEDAMEPMKLQATLAGVRMVHRLSKFGEYLGIETTTNITRFLSEQIALFHPRPNPGTLKVKDALFNAVPVRIYTPVNVAPGSRGIVHIHGGGWTILSIDAYDAFVRRLAEETNAVVVSVSYRLSPEFPYPYPLDDCVMASRYFLKHAEKYSVNRNRIAIMGDSAGGNLAMATALKINEDISIPNFQKMVLVYPALQAFDMNSPSYQEFSESDRSTPSFCTKEILVKYWQLYAFGGDRYLSDLLVNNHTSFALKNSEYSKYVDHKRIPEKFRQSKHYKGPVKNDAPTNSASSKFWEGMVTNPYFSPLMASDAQLESMPHTYILTAAYDALRDDGFWLADRLNQLHLPYSHDHFEGYEHGFCLMMHYNVFPKVLQKFSDFLEEL